MNEPESEARESNPTAYEPSYVRKIRVLKRPEEAKSAEEKRRRAKGKETKRDVKKKKRERRVGLTKSPNE